MSFKITTVTAYVAVDPKGGDEGVIGLPLDSSTLTLPCIGADEDRIMSLYPIVSAFCERHRVEFKVLRFSVREDVTEQVKEKFK